MMSMVDDLFEFERRTTSGELVWFRMLELFVVTLTIYWAWDWAHRVQTLHSVVMPLGLAHWFDIDFMFSRSASLWAAAVTSAGCLLALGRVSPALSYGTALCGLALLYAARYSIGEIGHGSNFAGYGLLALCIGFAVGVTRDEQRRLARGLMLWLLALGYLSAGLSKLIASGPSWVDGYHLWLWMGEKNVDVLSKFGESSATLLQRVLFESRTLSGLTLAFGLLTELSGLALCVRRTRLPAAAAVVALHVGIDLTMRIDFSQFIVHVALLALPGDRAIDWLLARPGSFSVRLGKLASRLA